LERTGDYTYTIRTLGGGVVGNYNYYTTPPYNYYKLDNLYKQFIWHKGRCINLSLTRAEAEVPDINCSCTRQRGERY